MEMPISGLSKFLLDFSRPLGYNIPSGLLVKYAKDKRDEPLAQLAEHLTFNQGVRGSNPRWFTIIGAQKRYVPHKPRFYRGFLLSKRRDFKMHIRRYKTAIFALRIELNSRTTE